VDAMNRYWRIEFLLMESTRYPAQRQDWLRLAREWCEKDGVDLNAIAARIGVPLKVEVLP